MTNNTDDLSLRGLCPRIVSYADRYKTFKDSLCRFRSIDGDHLSDLNVHIYNCAMEVVKTPNITTKRLESTYQHVAVPMLNSERITINELTKGWVRVLDLQKVLLGNMKDYDDSYTAIAINKTIGGISYSAVIDCLLMRQGDTSIDVLMVLPKLQTHKSMRVLSNLETILAIDYLEEAGINVGKITEVSYSHLLSDKNILCRDIHPNKNVRMYGRDVISSLGSNRSISNLSYCLYCPYNQRCSLTTRV